METENKTDTDGSPPSPIKVLLIDDEVAYVNILAKRLAKRGFYVKVAYSGSQGILTLREEDFNVAIVDLKMEDMDGIEVLKVFKKMLPGIALIILTGHGSEQAAMDGIRFGAFDYLIKPCELDDLINRVMDAYKASKNFTAL
ncbi:MAG: response regulator [Deltaproteobacteria bacterium]|nr:response regulator [Deltaproteobacteria bacterium]